MIHRLSEPLLSLLEHLLVDIQHDHAHIPIGVLQSSVVEDPLRDVSGSTSDVETLPSFLSSSSRIENRDERVLPQTMNTEGHGVVHHVVRRRDGGEDSSDWKRRKKGDDELGSKEGGRGPKGERERKEGKIELTERLLVSFRNSLESEMSSLIRRSWGSLGERGDGGSRGWRRSRDGGGRDGGLRSGEGGDRRRSKEGGPRGELGELRYRALHLGSRTRNSRGWKDGRKGEGEGRG